MKKEVTTLAEAQVRIAALEEALGTAIETLRDIRNDDELNWDLEDSVEFYEDEAKRLQQVLES